MVVFPEPSLPFWWILFRSFLVPAGGIDGVNVGVDLDAGFDTGFDAGFDAGFAVDLYVALDEDLEDDNDRSDLGCGSRISLLFGIFANGGV